jgi:hypothetical protein
MRRTLFLTIFFTACASNGGQPKEVLPPHEMGAVLYDVIQADELVDFAKFNDSTYQRFSRRTALYDTVFSLHGVTKNDFRKSLEYYQSRPDLLKDILEDLAKKAKDTVGKQKPKIFKKLK